MTKPPKDDVQRWFKGFIRLLVPGGQRWRIGLLQRAFSPYGLVTKIVSQV